MNEAAKSLGRLAMALGILLSGTARAQTVLVSQEEQRRPIDVTLAGPGDEALNAQASQAASATVTLDALVGEALQKNPAIKSAARRVQALRARVPQAKSLPDPIVSGGWMGNITPFDIQRSEERRVGKECRL